MSDAPDQGRPGPDERPGLPHGARKRRLLQRIIADTSSRTYRAIALARRTSDQLADSWEVARSCRASSHTSAGDLFPESVGLTRYRGRQVSAARRRTGDVLSSHAAALLAIRESADAAQVPIFAYRESSTTVRVGTNRRHAWPLLRQLRTRSSQSGRPICLAVITRGRLRHLSDIQDFPARLIDDASVLAVGLPVVDPLEQQVLGIAEAVHVEFWSEEANGDWRSPTQNRWGNVLPEAAREPSVLEFAGVSLPSFQALSEPHVDDIDFDIDAVVTWVDDTDPRWQSRLAQYSGSGTGFAADRSRYWNLDELRFCLRSLRTYAPWIRRIHLVTDQQSPAWLIQNDRIRVVDHREIWTGSSGIPTFNSHAIESALHHIPGLASHYLYLNDDVFLGRAAAPEHYFTSSGLARIFPGSLVIGLGPANLRDGFPSIAARNDRALLKQAVGRVQTTKLIHSPIPQIKEVAWEMERLFPAEYELTRRSRFRSPTDISPISLQSWYGYATGRFIASQTINRYYDLLTDELRSRLKYLQKHRHADSFCLNMGETSDQRSHLNARAAQAFLRRFFPYAPEWERTESHET